jgi:hypothetical protein
VKIGIPIHLAVEDVLSEWVLRHALKQRRATYHIGGVFGHEGCGYLKKQTPAFNNAAKGCPFLMLADLDRLACPPELIEQWLGRPKHQHFLLRVAIREVESWLLGDIEGLGHFLGLRTVPVLSSPESLSDPKDQLLRLAAGAPNRQMREALVWKDPDSGRLRQGPDYNGTLARFVIKTWNLARARRVCRSLDRLFVALQRLEADFKNK